MDLKHKYAHRPAESQPNAALRIADLARGEWSAPRNRTVDLETRAIGPTTDPRLRTQSIFQKRFIAAVRQDHPLARVKLTSTLNYRTITSLLTNVPAHAPTPAQDLPATHEFPGPTDQPPSSPLLNPNQAGCPF